MFLFRKHQLSNADAIQLVIIGYGNYNAQFNLKPGLDVEVLGKRATKTPFPKILIKTILNQSADTATGGVLHKKA